MGKHEYLRELERRLKGMPQEEKRSTLAYYAEMLEERIEEGMSEEEAVAQLESPEEIAARLVAEEPAKEKQNGNWALLLLSLPLLIVMAAVILSLLATLWAAVLSLWIADIAVIASGVLAGIGSPILFAKVMASGMVTLGGGLVCVGVGLLMLYPCVWTTRGMVWLSVRAVRLLTRMIIGKKGE